MNRHAPTTQERIALERIEASQTRSYLALLMMVGLILSRQLLPERYAAGSAIASVALVIGMVAMLVYRACFLRCPRCSGWIVIPKCPACGLKLDKPTSHRRSANT
jgi:hypothetical protein